MTVSRTGRETAACFSVALCYLLLRAPSLEFFLGSSDHGMQLSMGRQVLFGRLPFVDVLGVYGPLVTYASALGLLVHDSLLPEALICAAGYAACIAILYGCARREMTPRASAAVALAALLCLARFYKWYYWLFPLIALERADRYLRSGGGTRRLVGAGLAGGVAWLFRADLGLLFLAVFAVVSALDRIGRGGLRAWARDLATLAAAVGGPVALWLAILWLGGGSAAIVNYAEATFRGGLREAVQRALPLGVGHGPSAGSAGAVTAVLFALMPAAELAGLAAGLALLWRSGRRPTPPSGLLLAASLTGLAVFPQAMHRTDLSHEMQVLPPFLLVLPLLAQAAWLCARRLEPRVGHAVRAGVVLGFIGCVSLAVVAIPHLPHDLDADVLHAPTRWRRLGQGLAAAGDAPAAAMARAVQGASGPTSTILPALPLAYHVTFFTDRPVSGMFTTYAAGFMDWPRLRALNLARVTSAPPLFVITDGKFDDPDAPWSFRRSQPELYAYLSANYRRVVFEKDGLRLLARER